MRNVNSFISLAVRKAKQLAFVIIKSFIPLGAFIVRTNPKLRELILDALASSPLNNAGQALISTRAVTDNEGNLLVKAPNISLDSEVVLAKAPKSLVVLCGESEVKIARNDLIRIHHSSSKIILSSSLDLNHLELPEAVAHSILNVQSKSLNSIIRESLDDSISTVVIIDANATISYQEYMLANIYLNSRAPYAAVATQTSKTPQEYTGIAETQRSYAQQHLELNEKQFPVLLGNSLHVQADFFRAYLLQTQENPSIFQNLLADVTKFLNSRNVSYLSRLRNDNDISTTIKESINYISESLPQAERAKNKSIRSLKILSHSKELGLNRYKIRDKNRVLFIQPISGGGLKFANELLSEILAGSVETYHLVSSGNSFKILDGSNGRIIVDEEINVAVDSQTHRSPDYDGALAKWLLDLEIDLVHVEHMAWQSVGLADVCRLVQVPYVVSIHDFYLSCASHTLLDETNKPCFGKCTDGSGPCNVALWPKSEFQSLKNNAVFAWREHLEPILTNASRLIAPSNFAADQIRKSYPSHELKFKIIPHALRFEQNSRLIDLTLKKIETPLKVAIVGELTENKGAKEIEKIHKADSRKQLEFHFFGEAFGSISAIGVHHGPYKQSELGKKLQEIKPNVALFAAVGPETFSFTLSEIWANGIPVVGRELGAIGERIKESGAGILVSPNASAEEWLDALLKLGDLSSKESVSAESSLKRWLGDNQFENAKSNMKKSYLEIYSTALLHGIELQ